MYFFLVGKLGNQSITWPSKTFSCHLIKNVSYSLNLAPCHSKKPSFDISVPKPGILGYLHVNFMTSKDLAFFTRFFFKTL